MKKFRATTNANALRRRFGETAFNPTLYGTLALWLDAADSSTVTLSSTTVTQWRDKSVNGNNAAPVGSPVFASTGLNGKPSILLNGTSTGFRGAIANTGTVCTAFVVATLNTSTATNGRLVSLVGATGTDYNNASYLVPLLRDVNNRGIQGYYNNLPLSQLAVSAYDTPFYATSVADGTNLTNYVNGTAGTPGAMSMPGSFAITKYAVGIQPNTNGDYWKGYVSEVLIYNSALSTPNRQLVETYLATKWGI